MYTVLNCVGWTVFSLPLPLSLLHNTINQNKAIYPKAYQTRIVILLLNQEWLLITAAFILLHYFDTNISIFCFSLHLHFFCIQLQFSLIPHHLFIFSSIKRVFFPHFRCLFDNCCREYLTMIAFRLAIRQCPKMSRKWTPSSLLTSVCIATRRSLSVLPRSKSSTFLFVTFVSAITKSCRSPCASRDMSTSLKWWMVLFHLMSTSRFNGRLSTRNRRQSLSPKT